MQRLIRRYENRKLYDTVAKKYVSLAELADLIRQGHEIRVVEMPSGEDVTTRTLSNIIIDAERSGQESLSSGFLHDLIRWGGEFVNLTVDQVEQQLDRLVRASLQRLQPVRQAQEDMRKLEERIRSLEAQLAAVADSGPSRRKARRRGSRKRKEASS